MVVRAVVVRAVVLSPVRAYVIECVCFFVVWGESIHNVREATEPTSQFILTKIATRAHHNRPHAKNLRLSVMAGWCELVFSS